MFDWISTKTKRNIRHEYHVLTPEVYLCDIFSMNPQIYGTKNTVPTENMPHFNKISFLQTTTCLTPTAQLRVLYRNKKLLKAGCPINIRKT